MMTAATSFGFESIGTWLVSNSVVFAFMRFAKKRSSSGAIASLSRREREVMALVVSGLLNKQVDRELGISEITVKAHRRNVMRKMKADSLADLVNKAAGLRPAPAPKRAIGA